MPEVDSISVELIAKTKDFVKGFSKATSTIDKFKEKLSAAANTVAIASAAISIAGHRAIKAAEIQINAETKLSTAIRATGKQSSISASNLKKYASRLQLLTTFGDEVYVSSQSLLVSFGMSERQIKSLLPKIADFAAATGTDLSTATKMLGRLGTEGAAALSRYGVSLSNNEKELLKYGNQTQRVSAAVDIINKRFGGTASALAKTDMGKYTQAMNALGDTWEDFGKVVLKTIQPTLKDLNKFLFTLSEFMKRNPAIVESLMDVAMGIASIGAVLGAMEIAKALMSVAGSLLSVSAGGIVLALKIAVITAGLIGVAAGAIYVKKKLDEFFKTESGKKFMDTLKDIKAWIKSLATSTIDFINDAFDALDGRAKNARKSDRSPTEKVKDRIEYEKKYFKGTVQDIKDWLGGEKEGSGSSPRSQLRPDEATQSLPQHVVLPAPSAPTKESQILPPKNVHPLGQPLSESSSLENSIQELIKQSQEEQKIFEDGFTGLQSGIIVASADNTTAIQLLQQQRKKSTKSSDQSEAKSSDQGEEGDFLQDTIDFLKKTGEDLKKKLEARLPGVVETMSNGLDDALNLLPKEISKSVKKTFKEIQAEIDKIKTDFSRGGKKSKKEETTQPDKAAGMGISEYLQSTSDLLASDKDIGGIKGVGQLVADGGTALYNSLVDLGDRISNSPIGKQVGQALVSQMGSVGQIIDGFVGEDEHGNAQLDLGAGLAAVFTEILANSEVLQKAFKLVNDVFLDIVKAIDPLFEGLGPLVQILQQLIDPILVPLTGIFKALGDILGSLFAAFVPLFQIIGALYAVYFAPLVPLLDALAWVIGLVSRGIFEVFNAIVWAWNTMMDGIIKVLKGINKIAKKLKMGFGKYIGQIEELKIDKIEWDEANKSVSDLGDAAKEATEAMLNIPTVFKTEQARYNSIVGESVPGVGVTSTGGDSTGGGISSGMSTDGTIDGRAYTPTEARDLLSAAIHEAWVAQNKDSKTTNIDNVTVNVSEITNPEDVIRVLEEVEYEARLQAPNNGLNAGVF